MPIANRGLGHLREQRLRVTQQQELHVAITMKFVLKPLSDESVSACSAYRLIGQRLKDEFHRNGDMQLLLLRYTQSLLTQMAQTAVCNRHHSVHQQLCRWLLLSLDRLPSNQLVMTQELIANMLG